jgi:hypothetical protein
VNEVEKLSKRLTLKKGVLESFTNARCKQMFFSGQRMSHYEFESQVRMGGCLAPEEAQLRKGARVCAGGVQAFFSLFL